MEEADRQGIDLEELFRAMTGMRAMGRHETHESLVSGLIQEGCLRTSPIIDAFKEVDRRHFLHPDVDLPYSDAPVRHGKLHQSAPSVYAQALEALELAPGLSFLNIGSGTGYLSALAAQVIGKESLNVGVERQKELVEHARAKCAEIGLSEIQFEVGNCFGIDVTQSMRFDRIYLGAGAPRDARFLFKLLKYDGVIVGPFEDEDGGAQTLTKARCRGGKKFAVSKLLSVQFAELVKPSAHNRNALDCDSSPLVLGAPQWDVSRRSVFPPAFQRMVMFFYWMNCQEGKLPSKLPWDIWTKYIITFLPFDSYSTTQLRSEGKCAQCDAPGPSSQCGKCKAVRYCGRECQRKHWSVHKGVCGKDSSPKEPS